MVEHLAKVVAIYPSAARRTLIKMLLFGQIAHAHAMANMPPARKLNDRAGPFSHVGPADTRTPPERASKAQGAGPREPSGECFLRIVFFMTAPHEQRLGSPEVPHEMSGTNSPLKVPHHHTPWSAVRTATLGMAIKPSLLS
jgi:hypothetical protein